MKLDTRYFNAVADLFEGPIGRGDGARLSDPGNTIDLAFCDANEVIDLVRRCYRSAPRIVKGLKLLGHLVKILRLQGHTENEIAPIVLRLGKGTFPALTFEQGMDLDGQRPRRL